VATVPSTLPGRIVPRDPHVVRAPSTLTARRAAKAAPLVQIGGPVRSALPVRSGLAARLGRDAASVPVDPSSRR
jgi:hypothetical protein